MIFQRSATVRKIGRNKENKLINVYQNKWSIPLDREILRESTFFIGGGTGLRRGGSLVNFFYKSVKPVLFATGGGSQFFLAR